MARNSDTPYLRLVVTPRLADRKMMPSHGDGALVGFVDMSRMSDDAFETIVSRMQPSWVFDLRPVPYFDIGRLNRRRVFDLFRALHASYRDVAGALQITEHNDASLNSGAVGRTLVEMMATRPGTARVMVLVDDDEVLDHARHVLPRYLGACLSCALDVDVSTRDGQADVVARTESGELFVLEAKMLGERNPGLARMVDAFQFWFGHDMFAMTLEFDDGRATQMALPNAAAATFAQHLDVAISRCLETVAHGSSALSENRRRLAHDNGQPMHVVALRVERVRVQEAVDGASILITFDHGKHETRAIFALDGARQLRVQLQNVERR